MDHSLIPIAINLNMLTFSKKLRVFCTAYDRNDALALQHLSKMKTNLLLFEVVVARVVLSSE